MNFSTALKYRSLCSDRIDAAQMLDDHDFLTDYAGIYPGNPTRIADLVRMRIIEADDLDILDHPEAVY